MNHISMPASDIYPSICAYFIVRSSLRKLIGLRSATYLWKGSLIYAWSLPPEVSSPLPPSHPPPPSPPSLPPNPPTHTHTTSARLKSKTVEAKAGSDRVTGGAMAAAQLYNDNKRQPLVVTDCHAEGREGGGGGGLERGQMGNRVWGRGRGGTFFSPGIYPAFSRSKSPPTAQLALTHPHTQSFGGGFEPSMCGRALAAGGGDVPLPPPPRPHWASHNPGRDIIE